VTFPAAQTRSSHLDDVLGAELTRLREADRERILRPVGHRRGAMVQTDTGPAVDFSSNDYLGLASDPRLSDAVAHVAAQQGVGATASRLIAGNHPEHVRLEATLADAFRAEGALTFSSGYAANVGIIPALVGRGDALFADALNHASLIDGCRLSRARVHVYPHRDVAALAALLDQFRGGARRAMIVSDGLFSMDGDLAPLGEITDLARRFDAWTYVDDAHAAGVLGRGGVGTAELLGLHGEIDVTVATLGKAFGAGGAFVLGSATLVQYLVNRARSFVFSTAMPPAQAAAAERAVRIAAAEPERRDRACQNAKYLRDALCDAGVAVLSSAELHATHIVPVMIGDDARVARIGRDLAHRGLLVGAVRPPTVPIGGARLRITVSAAHTTEQIAALSNAVATSLRP
jgi:8-amino-7-oxononanoate synthase